MEIAKLLGVSLDTTSELYLGATISASQGSYDILLEKTSAKLSMSESQTLTQAGRLVLIKSALQSVPIYYMATAQIPKKVLHSIEALTRNFFGEHLTNRDIYSTMLGINSRCQRRWRALRLETWNRLIKLC